MGESVLWAGAIVVALTGGNALVHHDWFYNATDGWHFSSEGFSNQTLGFVERNAQAEYIIPVLFGGMFIEGAVHPKSHGGGHGGGHH